MNKLKNNYGHTAISFTQGDPERQPGKEILPTSELCLGHQFLCYVEGNSEQGNTCIGLDRKRADRRKAGVGNKEPDR